MRLMRSTFILLLVLLLAMTACGGGEEETPDDSRGETAVVEETATEAPAEPTEAPAEPTEAPAEPTEAPAEPTEAPAEPTEVPAVEAPAAGFDSFSSAEGGFTISYPTGWLAEDLFGFTTFASNEELLDSPDPGEEGGVAILVAGPTDEFEGDTTDPIDLLNTAFTDFGIGEDATITSGPTATTVNGLPAATARFTATADESDEMLSGVIGIVVSEPLGRAAVFFGVTPSVTEGEFVPTFETMFSTVALSEAAEVGIPDVGGSAGGGEVIAAGSIAFGESIAALVQDGGSTTLTFTAAANDVIDVIVEPDDALDAVIDVRDAAGNSIIGGEVDDSFGTEEVRQLLIPAAGEYIVAVRGFADGGGTFTLTVSKAGAAATGENVIGYGDFITNNIAASEVDVWQFNGSQGDLVNLTVTPLDDNDLPTEAQFDLTINILDGSGLSINGGLRDLSYDSEFLRQIELPASGAYSIEIAGFDATDFGEYELTLEDARRGLPTTIVSASDNFEEGEGIEDGHRFPFTADVGEVVTFQAEPEFGLNLRVEVYNEDTDTLLDEYSTNLTTGFEEVVFFTPEDGNYYFELKLNDETDLTSGGYDVTIVTHSTVLVELAGGDAVFGETGGQGYVEYWLGGDTGQSFTVATQTEDDIDLVIEIYDQQDNLLASIDDNFSGEAEELVYTFAEDTLVIIRISDFFEAEGDFEATVNLN